MHLILCYYCLSQKMSHLLPFCSWIYENNNILFPIFQAEYEEMRDFLYSRRIACSSAWKSLLYVSSLYDDVRFHTVCDAQT